MMSQFQQNTNNTNINTNNNSNNTHHLPYHQNLAPASFILHYLQGLRDSPDPHIARSIAIRDIRSASPASTVGDRFKISLPYCGTVIHVQLVFNLDCPQFAPDIIVLPSTTSSPTTTTTTTTIPSDASPSQDQPFPIDAAVHLPVLRSWSHTHPSHALTTLLSQLTSAVSTLSQHRLQNHPHPRLSFEYSTVSDIPGARFYADGEEARFSIPVEPLHDDEYDHNTNNTNNHTNNNNDTNNNNNNNRTRMNTSDSHENQEPFRLFLVWDPSSCRLMDQYVERVEDGDRVSVALPTLTEERCTAEHVTAVAERLRTEKRRMDRMKAAQQVKESLLDALTERLGNPLEINRSGINHNNMNNNNTGERLTAAFLLVDDDQSMVMFVVLPALFPEEAPSIQVQSMCSAEKSSGCQYPIMCRFKHLPYDTKWEASQVADSILKRVETAKKEFRKICSKYYIYI